MACSFGSCARRNSGTRTSAFDFLLRRLPPKSGRESLPSTVIPGDVSDVHFAVLCFVLILCGRPTRDIVIAALEWSAPGWVGNGSFFSDDNIEYIMGWLYGAESVNRIRVNYLGIWNEPPIQSIPTDWILSLRAALDGAGYDHIDIIAPDASPTQSVTTILMSDMVSSSDLRSAVKVIGGASLDPPSAARSGAPMLCEHQSSICFLSRFSALLHIPSN